MSIEEVIAFFGTAYRVGKELGLSNGCVNLWKRRGYIPMLQQYRIAELTEGALMPDDENPAPIYGKGKK